eukprot:Nk52_evm35s24 gene=Nk52_evmTU35s24
MSLKETTSPAVKTKAILLIILLCCSFVCEVNSAVIRNTPSDGHDALRDSNDSTDRPSELLDASSDTSVTYTWHTTGNSLSKGRFLLGKQTLAHAALKMRTRLPSNTTGYNATYIVNQITPVKTKMCNESALADVCNDLLLYFVMASGDVSGELPFLYPELLLILATSSVDIIGKFAQYGCIDGFALDKVGLAVTMIPDGVCPVKFSSDSLSKLKNDVGEDQGSCWSSKTWFSSQCSAANPLNYIGQFVGSLALGGGIIYFFYKSQVAQEKDLQEVIQEQLRANGQLREEQVRLIQLEIRQFELKAENPFIKRNYRNRGVEKGRQQGAEDLRSLRTALAEKNQELEDASIALRNEEFMLEENEVTNKELFGYLQRAFSGVEDIVKVAEQGFFPATSMSELESKVDSALENARTCLTGELLTFAKLTGGGENCPDFEEIRGNMGQEAVITDRMVDAEGKLPSSNAEIDEVATISDELSGLSGREAELVTADAAAELSGLEIGSMILGNVIGVVAGFANMFIMMGLVTDLVQGAVREINSALDKGFNETALALQDLQKQQEQEFASTISFLDSRINELKASLECHDAWTSLQESAHIISSDYNQFTNTHNHCKISQNFTGAEYYYCYYENLKDIYADHDQTYTLVGNMAEDGSVPWEKSVVGRYLYECTKFHVIKGYEPSLVAQFIDQSYLLTSTMVRQAGSLYRWSASWRDGYEEHFKQGTSGAYKQQMSDGYFISVNRTTDLASWLVGSVVPPALGGMLSYSLYRDAKAMPESHTYHHVEVINMTSFQSEGHIVPSIWLPSDSDRVTESKGSFLYENGRNMDYTNVSESSDIDSYFNDYPKLQKLSMANVTNLTASVQKVAQSFGCSSHLCTTKAISSPSQCTGCTDAGCICDVLVTRDTTLNYPARGWASVYNPDSSDRENTILPTGLTPCTSKESQSNTTQCLSGMLIQNLDNDRLLLWGNASHALHWPAKNSWERKKLPLPKDKVLFQMWEQEYSWKYDVGEEGSKYLAEYFAEQPYYLKNPYGFHNVTELSQADNWRYYWGVGPKDATDGEVLFVKVTRAETIPNARSSFGFSCPAIWNSSQDKESSLGDKCLLKTVGLPYPPTPQG